MLIKFDAPGYEDLKLKGDDHHDANEANKTEAQVQATAEAGQDVAKAETPKEVAPTIAASKGQAPVVNEDSNKRVIAMPSVRKFAREQRSGYSASSRLR